MQMTLAARKLITVTTASWLSKDLAAAGTIPVEASLGLDAPHLETGDALWCSGAWASRLLKSGAQHPFLSAGPHWLGTVPQKYLRRNVWSGRLHDMTGEPVRAFYKLAEHKHGLIPARVRPSQLKFQQEVLLAFGIRNDIPGLFDLAYTASEPVRYVREYRCFIANGRVTAASFYSATLTGAGSDVTITWDAYESADDPRLPAADDAAAFAQEVVDAMGDNQPPGYTLDVGTDEDGNFSVIEANAAWSSNIYHADPRGVLESVLASQQPGHEQWLWRPDAVFFDRSRPLPRMAA